MLALAARRAAGAGPLAVVCCDNLSNNGTVARNAVAGFAGAWDAGLAAWIDANISFVSTSVDRITPRTTDADLAAVEAACGYRDNSPVVAEPFSNWVLSGDFPAGRPRWEDAGAVFVADIEPYENRKLWLLNGAHSLLAYAGQLRGHTTVAQALADPLCLQAVESFWDEAEANLAGSGTEAQNCRSLPTGPPSWPASATPGSPTTWRKSPWTAAPNCGCAPSRSCRPSVPRAVPGPAAALMIAAWMDFTAGGHSVQDPLAGAIGAANHLTGLGTDAGPACIAGSGSCKGPVRHRPH